LRAFYSALAVACLLIACIVSPVAAKQLEGVPREQHPWGQFKIGSWKRVRTHTENLDEKGAVVSTSTTETTTKLVDVDDEGYTLRVDVVVEVAGKRFTAQPQIIRRGYNGEGDGQEVSVKKMGEAGVTINGRQVTCEVRKITVDANDIKRITTVHYTDSVAPYVLKRETTSINADGKPADFQSQVDVVAFDMPTKVGTETKSTSLLRILNQQGKTTTLTLEVNCLDVPGGVVSHTSKETDEAGRITRRSTLELLDYALGTGEDPEAQMVRKVFHRAKVRRASR
jgi:hypothetical protein